MAQMLITSIALSIIISQARFSLTFFTQLLHFALTFSNHHLLVEFREDRPSGLATVWD